jgi:hypothetical protein
MVEVEVVAALLPLEPEVLVVEVQHLLQVLLPLVQQILEVEVEVFVEQMLLALAVAASS